VKDRVFRDPVHGLIEFKGEDLRYANILETRAFQRLRRIRQMGFARLVYPGAEHSRFGHALGAYQMATRVVRALELEPEVSGHVRLAGLLHDIGHGPFSHAWEHVFGGGDHEAWGARMVREDEELASVLAGIEPGLAEVLAGFWEKTYSPKYARKLVSSQLDIDRLDYLLRDGHYSGAGYATYDLDWLIHALGLEKVREGDDPDTIDLVVDYGRGMYAVEQYLFARSYMYAQVYHHKTVRAAECMFIELMGRFAELARTDHAPPHLEVAVRMARGEPISVADYLWLDDVSLTSAIDHWAGHGPGKPADDPILRDLSHRLVSRRLFKTVDLGDDPAVLDGLEPRIAAAAELVMGEHASYYYVLDHSRHVDYHPDANQELYVVGHPRYGTVTLSRLLEEIPLGQPRSRVRLICAPELLEVLAPIARAAITPGS
jgi:HD superfamily phosphohydrolase